MTAPDQKPIPDHAPAPDHAPDQNRVPENMRDRFIAGMADAAATVNIVTTDGPAGRMGVTVSAMSSVSADTPNPTLLVCVHHMSPAASAIIENGCFCVNVLRDDQSYISDTFAGRFSADVPDKFACSGWATMATGAPRVVDPLVAFDCRVISSERVGTHHVFIGEVMDVFQADGGSPLIYSKRAYGRATRIEPVARLGSGGQDAKTRLSVGCFHTFGPYVLPEILAQMQGQSDLTLTLVEGDHRRIVESLKSGETDVALLYDFGLSADFKVEILSEVTPRVLFAADHPLAQSDTVTLESLLPHPMILLDTPPSADYFLGLFDGIGTPDVRYRSDWIEMVRGLVGRGLGYAILGTRPASDITYDGRKLVTRPIANPVAPSRIVLATRSDHPSSSAAAMFSKLCQDVFAHTG